MFFDSWRHRNRLSTCALLGVAALVLGATAAEAAPTVTRLNPPSKLFATSGANTSLPFTSRFLPGQRFDLQATIQADASTTITAVQFFVDGTAVTPLINTGPTAGAPGALAAIGSNRFSATFRAYSNTTAGGHSLTVTAQQSDGQTVTASGNFEVVQIQFRGRPVKNIIYMVGDGMGIAHRTAARIVMNSPLQGKAQQATLNLNLPGYINPNFVGLSMDQFPYTGIVVTHSLNSIVTDSSPGANCYSTGNKSNNSQHGVFPDDTADNGDNPRVEHMSEYLARTAGKSLGIVSTADIFDATPAAFATHTQARGSGTGIIDEYFATQSSTNLSVLMGGGRKWFLPSTTPGSARTAGTEYVFPADVLAGWYGATSATPLGSLIGPNASDPTRDVLNSDWLANGWTYAPTRTALNNVNAASTKRLLGLFTLSNMNVAYDKIGGRRGTSSVVGDYRADPTSPTTAFNDQPMLEEMTAKALDVLKKNQNGFVLMVEGASIDKQAHVMDTERWVMDTIEFDKAIEVARQFASDPANGETLVIITADHECAGVNIIGASRVNTAALQANALNSPGNVAIQRDATVGTYDNAGFPRYAINATDGYPVSMDPDFKMLIGYAGNADRYETWLSNALPAKDSQQPFITQAPLSNYPVTNTAAVPTGTIRNATTGFSILGQVPGDQAVHTASDIPLSALGRGSSLFTGVQDNTDVFFKVMQAIIGGATVPAK